MRFFITKAFFVLILLVANSDVSFSNQLSVEEEVVITVFGMRCVGCELGIEREIGKLKGVVSVKADNSKNIVTVRYKKNLIKVDTIIDKINELGYRAEKPFK